MAELSRESGVAVATIKYYLREGLLHPGERTSPNQARYDETHLRRLRLVRALLDIGGLSVADVRAVLTAIDSRTSQHEVLGLMQHGLPLAVPQADDETRAWATEVFRSVVAERGWNVDREDPVAASLIGVLCTLRALGHAGIAELLGTYAEAAEVIAKADVDHVADLPTTEAVVEGAVVGTVLGDAMFVALRRLAHAEESAKRFRTA